MRAIDAEELKRSIAVSALIEDQKTLEQIIDEQPTIEERKTGRWIQCSEQLPEMHEEFDAENTAYYVSEDCLVTAWNPGQVTIAHYISDDFKGWEGEYGECLRDVTAWQPLPEPYKGTKKEK